MINTIISPTSLLAHGISPEEFKATLPTGRGGTAWSIETAGIYINLLYPHVTMVGGQEWSKVKTKYVFNCSFHGDYSAPFKDVVESSRGCGCNECKIQITKDSAGVRRRRKSSPEEKELAAKLHSQGMSYKAIARQLNRSDATIGIWLDPAQAEKARQHQRDYAAKNPCKQKARWHRYRSEFAHGIANRRLNLSLRRCRYQNTPDLVFVDGQWHEVDRKKTWNQFSEALLPQDERDAIEALYLEAQRLTETTEVKHHVDHIQPLSKGGEHLAINLQVIPASENLSKSNTFRIEDQALLCSRLFGSAAAS